LGVVIPNEKGTKTCALPLSNLRADLLDALYTFEKSGGKGMVCNDLGLFLYIASINSGAQNHHCHAAIFADCTCRNGRLK
jgi:hypothetical protein